MGEHSDSWPSLLGYDGGGGHIRFDQDALLDTLLRDRRRFGLNAAICYNLMAGEEPEPCPASRSVVGVTRPCTLPTGDGCMAELIKLERRCNERFKTIDLEIIENSNLSWKAKGLHTYLISRPPGWRLWHKDLVKRATDGKSALSSAVNELKEAGYLCIQRVSDHKGRVLMWRWIVAQTQELLASENLEPLLQEPDPENQDVDEGPESDCPDTDFPDVDNQHCSKKQGVLSTTSTKQHLPSDKPRMKQDDLTTLTEHYATIRGARPRGKAWQPIQQGMKAMVVDESYTVEQVTGCMDRIVELEWNWTINTVRKWISDFAAGKMPSKNGSSATLGIKRGSEYYERARKKEAE